MHMHIEAHSSTEVKVTIMIAHEHPISVVVPITTVRAAVMQAVTDLHAIDVADASIQYATHMMGGVDYEVE